MVKRREDLSAAASRRIGLGYDADAFGRFAESIARFLGTARFLVFQTVIIVFWLLWNVTMPDPLVFDSWARGFVLPHLGAVAPGVLRGPAHPARPEPSGGPRPPAVRDRPQLADRTQADTEFLARELASVRDARRRGDRRGAARPARELMASCAPLAGGLADERSAAHRDG
jgi:uncharacterized membrane protein